MNQKIGFFIFIGIMCLFLSGGCYYLGRRLLFTLPWLQSKKAYVYITLAVFVSLQILGPALYRISPWAAQRPFILQWLTYVTLGIVGSLFFYFLAAELLNLLLRKLPLFLATAEEFESLERRLFLGVGFFSLATAAIGTKTAIDGPQIESTEIPIKGLPQEFQGLKIAHISDLHVGPTIDREYAQRVVDLTLSLEPDLIVLTGDMIDGYPEELRYHLEPLRQLKAKHGVIYCAGNHEYYWGIDQWLEEFRSMGFKVLLNNHHLLEEGEAKLCVGGLADLRAHQFNPDHRADGAKTFAGIPKEMIKILLAHQPASYTHSLEQGVHLQLSGHTHGGQFFPFSIFVALTHKFYRGLYFHQDLWVYTNRGTGYWGPPQRFGVPPEITEIRLTRGA